MKGLGCVFDASEHRAHMGFVRGILLSLSCMLFSWPIHYHIISDPDCLLIITSFLHNGTL